jgi:hypothetical protein
MNGDVQLLAIAQDQVIASASLHGNLHTRRRHAVHVGMEVAAAAQGSGHCSFANSAV